jgi:hypothetical protein
MKRLKPDSCPLVESEQPLTDDDVILQLPKNAKAVKFKFSLSNLTRVEREDVQLITNIISYVAHHITQKHLNTRSWISTHQETLKGVKLVKYLVYMEMPASIPVNSHQFFGIHNLALELIVDPVVDRVLEDGKTRSLSIEVYSKKNPYLVEIVHVTHIHIKQLKLATVANDEYDAGGPMKRSRKSTEKDRS